MRDWLPHDTHRRGQVSGRLLQNLELFGYQQVEVPQFEYASIWQESSPATRGQLDGVMRFVESESGEVVALRPDVTPQIARLVTTRYSNGPWPARFSYHATVTRQRQERGRLARQVSQVGYELIGRDEVGGDLEVLEAATSGLRAAGLESFTVDLAHAQVAGSLLELLAPERRSDVLECLILKDSKRVEDLASRAEVSSTVRRALVALPELYGGAELWPKANKILGGTPAAEPLGALHAIWQAATLAQLAPRIVVDLGETRDFHYYTGAMFHLLAEGPGEPLGAGGRYDRLFERFDSAMPAAGFAFDLTNLCWALDASGQSERRPPKVLVTRPKGTSSETTLAVLRQLRQREIRCTRGPREQDPVEYGQRWGYSHILALTEQGAVLSPMTSGDSESTSGDGSRGTRLDNVNPSEIAEAVSAELSAKGT